MALVMTEGGIINLSLKNINGYLKNQKLQQICHLLQKALGKTFGAYSKQRFLSGMLCGASITVIQSPLTTLCDCWLGSSSKLSNHRIPSGGQNNIPQPLTRCFLVCLPMLVQLPLGYQFLLHRSSRSQPPFPGIRVSIHHHPLNLRNHPMITSRHHGCSHFRNPQCNGLSLGRHQHDFLSHLDIILEPQQPGNHQLRTVTNRVHGRILHHQPLVTS
nr:centromere/microtubule binding protein CBF5 [Ipomoea batatas]